MLEITEEAEAPLRKARQFMDCLDQGAFTLHKIHTARRAELEDLLDYLRL
jgi:hypothetical protein